MNKPAKAATYVAVTILVVNALKAIIREAGQHAKSIRSKKGR